MLSLERLLLHRRIRKQKKVNEQLKEAEASVKRQDLLLHCAKPRGRRRPSPSLLANDHLNLRWFFEYGGKSDHEAAYYCRAEDAEKQSIDDLLELPEAALPVHELCLGREGNVRDIDKNSLPSRINTLLANEPGNPVCDSRIEQEMTPREGGLSTSTRTKDPGLGSSTGDEVYLETELPHVNTSTKDVVNRSKQSSTNRESATAADQRSHNDQECSHGPANGERSIGRRSSYTDSIPCSFMSEGEWSFINNKDVSSLSELNEEDEQPTRCQNVAESLVKDFVANQRTMVSHEDEGSPRSDGQSLRSGRTRRGSGSSSTGITSWSSTPSSQRGQKQEHDDDDDDDDGCRRRKRPRKEGGDQMWLSKKLFACPYCKYDRNTYSEQNCVNKSYRKCATCYLPSIPRVKQHLYRVHRRPQFYCSCCFEPFTTGADREIHERGRTCSPVASPFAEKMTHDQMQQIKRRVMNQDEVKSWFDIFRILFPGAPLPADPWPTMGNVPSNVVDEFLDFFQAEAPARLSADITPRLIGETSVPGLQEFLDTTLELAMARLVETLRHDFKPYGEIAESRHG